MSKEYKGAGTLSHLVSEQLKKNERVNSINESEYFKTHTFQGREDERHDMDFKTVPTNDKTANLSVKQDDPMLKNKTEDTVDTLQNKKEIDNSDDDPKKPMGLDFYIKNKENKSENDKTDEKSSPNVKMGVYGESWYKELHGYMDDTNRDGIKDIVESYKHKK